jgi:hypothetical protein
MSKVIDPLRLAIAEVLADVGFTRRGLSWFRSSDDVVEVVNLQKSQYGSQYYVNYAIWLRRLGDASFPKEEHCHIRMRASTICASEELRRLLDLESDIDGDARRSAFARLLTNEFVPFSDSCRSLAGLRQLYEQGRFKQAMVDARAKALLRTATA